MDPVIDQRDECNIPQTAGCLPLDFLLKLPAGCRIPANRQLCFGSPVTIEDRHGHDLDGDYDPLGHKGCQHKDTPEWKQAHRKSKKETPMSEQKTENPVASAALTATPVPETLAVAVTPAPPPAVTQTTATVGVDAAVNQIKALLPAGTDASPGLLIGGAAGLAVVGAAVKMGPGLLKARAERLANEKERAHELEMEKLKLEEKRVKNQKSEKQSEKSDDQHGQCTAARLALEVRVAAAEQKSAALEARLIEVAARAEKAVSSAPSMDLGDFDPEDLEDRLKKLEKALKPAAPSAKKKRK